MEWTYVFEGQYANHGKRKSWVNLIPSGYEIKVKVIFKDNICYGRQLKPHLKLPPAFLYLEVRSNSPSNTKLATPGAVVWSSNITSALELLKHSFQPWVRDGWKSAAFSDVVHVGAVKQAPRSHHLKEEAGEEKLNGDRWRDKQNIDFYWWGSLVSSP